MTRADLSIKPTLAGERVVLRPVTEADAPLLFEMLADQEASRLTGSHRDFDFEEARRWYASRAATADRLDLAITDRASGEYLGEIVLNNHDADNGSCNLRIILRRCARNRGVGTEAMRRLLDHAFETLGLHRVSLEVYAFNPRARRVYDKLGFVVEGVRRDALRWDGQFVDAVLMSMLAPEWAAHRGRPEASR